MSKGAVRFPLTWVDGQVHVAGTSPGVDPSDHGIVVGDGVFETVRVLGGRPFALGAHLDRLLRSAAGLSLTTPDRSAIDAAVAAVCQASSGLHDGRLRITVTGGPSPLSSVRGKQPPVLLVGLEPSTPVAELETVATCPWTLNERGPLAGLKTTSYAGNVRALAWAKRHGAGEALFHNTRGEVSEGTGSNLFAVLDGTIVTPPTDSSGCLAGITRALVLEQNPGIVERPLQPAELLDATELFLTSTTRDVQPVGRLDDHQLTTEPGPATLEVRARFLDHQRAALGT
jgi:branched-chain amino acid aminotransferase